MAEDESYYPMAKVVFTGPIWEDDKLVGDENGLFENVPPVVASKKTESRTLYLYKLKCEQYRELKKINKDLKFLKDNLLREKIELMKDIELCDEREQFLEMEIEKLRKELALAHAKIELLLATHGEKTTKRKI